MVAEYTLIFYRDGPEPVHTQSLSFANDVEAIREAGAILAQQAQGQRQPATSICVGRGSGDEPEWLGAWDVDGVPRWRPEE